MAKTFLGTSSSLKCFIRSQIWRLAQWKASCVFFVRVKCTFQILILLVFSRNNSSSVSTILSENGVFFDKMNFQYCKTGLNMCLQVIEGNMPRRRRCQAAKDVFFRFQNILEIKKTTFAISNCLRGRQLQREWWCRIKFLWVRPIAWNASVCLKYYFEHI